MAVSVIVPTYNAAETLDRCLRSLVAQTKRLHEIIVVDDGSTDDSLAVAREIARLHPEILVFSQPNAGVSAARNHGLRVATGDYIGFVDPDDYVEASMFETMLAGLQLHGVRIAALSRYCVRPPSGINDGQPSQVISAAQARSNLLVLSYPSAVWAHLYAAEVLDGLMFDEQAAFFEDLLFNFGVLRRVDRVACISSSLYHYEPGALGANRGEFSAKHLSSLLVARRIRSLVNVSEPRLSGDAALFESSCLETVVYKASTAESRLDCEIPRAIGEFARANVWYTLRSKRVSAPRKALMVVAALLPRSLLVCLRLRRAIRQSVDPSEAGDR